MLLHALTMLLHALTCSYTLYRADDSWRKGMPTVVVPPAHLPSKQAGCKHSSQNAWTMGHKQSNMLTGCVMPQQTGCSLLQNHC